MTDQLDLTPSHARMTRRLEPMERVRELGDASVPFPFDVHALFFFEDAVAVERNSTGRSRTAA